MNKNLKVVVDILKFTKIIEILKVFTVFKFLCILYIHYEKSYILILNNNKNLNLS